jgi:D-alanine-D-alanine ligase
MRILVLHDEVSAGARPDEADALVQAKAVCGALLELGYSDSCSMPVSLDLTSMGAQIKRIAPDLVFNIVESLGGHGRLIHVIPGLLDGMRIPYTGVSAEAQFVTSNKLIAKRVLRASYLPTPPWHTQATLEAIADSACRSEERAFAPGRYIIKSVWEHASLGLDEDSVVPADDPLQLLEAMHERRDRLRGDIFAETYIDGREFNLALLADPFGTGSPSGGGGNGGAQVLPPAEIVFDGYRSGKLRVVGHRAKWDANSYEYHHTPPRYDFAAEDASLLDHLSSLAVECWRLFDVSGYARVDFRIDASGRPWILEINANPCLSPDAGFAAALRQAGIPFAQAVERIVNDALRAALADAHLSPVHHG